MPCTEREFSHPRRKQIGFTLIELLCVCAVIGILLATLVPAVGWQILQARVGAETTALQGLATAVQASFESADLEGTNLAAIAGSVPSGIDATTFSASTSPGFLPATTLASDWFAKIARQMGAAPQLGVAPTPAAQPQVAAILFNGNNNSRFMLLGPANEATQQRFLIGSLVAAPGQLALPPLPNPINAQDPANLALFNDIWNTNWTSPAAVLPPSWTAGLAPGQIQAWQSALGGRNRLWQFCVQRIVCPKFNIVINNTHPTDNCYVYYNINGTLAGNSAVALANGGTVVIPGVYFGRLIQAYRGIAAPPTAQLFSQFCLRDNNEITLQD
jgi:prepilin-type N-terminal cleavage/methylation domain-containing protein